MRTVVCLFTVSIYLAFNPFVHPAVADGDERGVAINTKTQDEPASTPTEIDMQHAQRLGNKQRRGESSLWWTSQRGNQREGNRRLSESH